jgi:GDP-mannose 6-dehydrogenase
MRVAVIGLGYVGATLAACLASEGHEVAAVERDAARAALVQAGEWPLERAVQARLKESVARLSIGADVAAAMDGAELVFVCVGTPSLLDGGLDLTQLILACEEIGKCIKRGQGVVIKSTVEPGTTNEVLITYIERAQMRAGEDFGVVFNPEFLREGSAVQDYYQPPFTVIGRNPGAANAATEQRLAELYRNVRAHTHVTTLKNAEMLKLACNAWHALKIDFANEIGRLCQAVGADSDAVMELLAEDKQLNISSAYLKPGWAFGGSCLPKDVLALLAIGEEYEVGGLALLRAIYWSNENLIEVTRQTITAHLSRRQRNSKLGKVGVVGLAHKAGTGDFRNSATIELAMQLRKYDVEVVEQDRPNAAALQDCDVVVLANRDAVPLLEAGVLPPDVLLVDLAHVAIPGPNVIRIT